MPLIPNFIKIFSALLHLQNKTNTQRHRWIERYAEHNKRIFATFTFVNVPKNNPKFGFISLVSSMCDARLDGSINVFSGSVLCSCEKIGPLCINQYSLRLP